MFTNNNSTANGYGYINTISYKLSSRLQNYFKGNVTSCSSYQSSSEVEYDERSINTESNDDSSFEDSSRDSAEVLQVNKKQL